MPDLVETAAQADAAWFTTLFAEHGHDVPVTAVEMAPIGTGQMAENTRATLRFAGSVPPEIPRSLVLKFASADPQSRAAGAAGSYAKEVAFYREVASTVQIATPTCWFAELADDRTTFTLVLEDMAPAIQGDQLAGCGVHMAQAAAANLAGLHGPRWGDPTLTTVSEMTPPGDAESSEFITALVQQFTPAFIERYDTHLTADHRNVLISFADAALPWLTRTAGRLDYSLVHADYRLDNLLFGPTAGQAPPAVTAVDWQTVNVGAPLQDLAYLLGTSLDPDVRQAAEVDLVAEYHQSLVGFGVSDMDGAQCWEQYCEGAFHSPLITVLGSMMVHQTDRGDAMFMAMLDRSVDQILHVDAMDHLVELRSR